MNIIIQKYIVWLLLASMNIVTTSTFIVYLDKWYIYLFILGLASSINAASALLMLGYRMFSQNKDTHYRIHPLDYLYIVPCYNESEEELSRSINSITSQQIVPGDRRSMIIICDGKVIGQNNIISTDKILKKILKHSTTPYFYEYTTWDNNKNTCSVYDGIYEYENYSMNYILIVKNKNYGKRDSIVLARKLCYCYNTRTLIDDMIGPKMIKRIGCILSKVHNETIDYIVGIDADTVFDYNCTYELIKMIDSDNSIHGCVGFVDICPSMNSYSPYVLYQYAEYVFAQCLRRQTQSSITSKVSCLSGCNQILRVSEETCGNKILQQFNYLPKDDDNIFNHIRSYASEDRNHVCLMLSIYPYVKTKQTLKAISYTLVPTSVKVFMSQRRRWSLGANANDMLLVYLPGINIFERISAFINVCTYVFSPFIFVATIFFIKSIIECPTYLMLYLSIPIIIPLLYSFMIPIFIKQQPFKQALYFYLSYLFFTIFGCIINLLIYFNSVLNMDVIKWGKTRTISTIKNSIDYSVDKDEAIDGFVDGFVDGFIDDIVDNDTILIIRDEDSVNYEYDDTIYDTKIDKEKWYV